MNVQERLYATLREWVPDLETATWTAAFYASPRHPDDLSIYCEVARQQTGQVQVRISHETPGRPRDKLDMEFSVDCARRTAALTHIDQGIPVDSVLTATSYPTRLTRATVFAVNWLTVMIGMHFILQPIEAPVSHPEQEYL